MKSNVVIFYKIFLRYAEDRIVVMFVLGYELGHKEQLRLLQW